MDGENSKLHNSKILIYINYVQKNITYAKPNVSRTDAIQVCNCFQAMQVTDVGAEEDKIGWWLKEVSTQHMHIFTIYPTQHSTGKHGAINVTTFIVTTFSPMIKS